MTVVLANATLACLAPRLLRRGHLSIDEGRISAITDDIPAGVEDVVDCSGRIIMPGNVCGHTHVYSALARGMPAPPQTPQNFPEILEFIWWRLDRALDAESVRYSGLIGALDAIRAGTTTLVDHHASPNYIEGSLDTLADAFSEVGVRGVLCYEVTDRGGTERRMAGIRENERFIRGNRRPLAAGLVGAHASFTLEDETLEQLTGVAASLGTGIHIHVAEDVFDEEDSLRRCGKRTAQRLLDAGILRAKSICAHGVHLQPQEVEAIRSRRSWLVHNCRSNMNNSVGRAPVQLFGERAALGTDGIDEDMFAESRTAYFRAREVSLDAYADQYTDLLAGGAALASQYFLDPVGRMEEGAAADLMVLAYDPPTPLTEGNLAWHWMFALTAEIVESVMVGGRWVLRKGEFVEIDEERIRFDARGQAERLWNRMSEL
jgi:putative selenium metabolism protein SsnA